LKGFGVERCEAYETEDRIVGEDEADPKSGSISFVTPVARLLMGKAVGDVVGTSDQELEIISIS
jgi:transcription elongation GreA/GreB family factor